MNSERFRFFPSVHLESDLVIGVTHQDFQETMPAIILKEQIRLYEIIKTYSIRYPSFITSLDPMPLQEQDRDVPPEISTMLRCGIRTGTGPMSSVAGLFAEAAGQLLTDRFNPGEVVVENGGDLYIRNKSELLSEIHAGKSALSGKLSLVIPPGSWGVCSSSGTLGHSYSRGKADVVTVVTENTPLADAWATALANRVKGPRNIEQVLDQASAIHEITSIVVIAGDKIGIRGDLEVKPLY
jgi:ApbE superfamily uncharacterized protein (UPF0280 family)